MPMETNYIYPEESPQGGCMSIVAMILAFILALLMCILMGSCRSIQYVPVETIKHDSIYINKVEKDSVYIQDSIYIKEKGDTVLIEKWKTRYVSKYITDTLFVTKVDSVQVPYPIEIPLTKWEQRYMTMGKVSVGVYVGLLLAFVLWLINWIKKKRK